jgi:hypothetical protein
MTFIKINPSTFSFGSPPYQVELQQINVGPNTILIISGGTHPHIGAVAIKDDHLESSRIIERLGHKEGALAKEISETLDPYFDGALTVTLGVHVDDASIDEIELLSRNILELVEIFKESLIKAPKV